MDKSNLPNEVAKRLQEIKRQNRNFTEVIIILVSILAVVVGYWFAQNPSYASVNQNSNDNVVQLSSSVEGGCGGSGGGCGGSGGGGCGSGGATQVSAPELEKAALETYKKQFGDKEGIRAKLMDFGCHQEVNIIDKDGNLLKRYSYRGGQLTLL